MFAKNAGIIVAEVDKLMEGAMLKMLFSLDDVFNVEQSLQCWTKFTMSGKVYNVWQSW